MYDNRYIKRILDYKATLVNNFFEVQTEPDET